MTPALTVRDIMHPGIVSCSRNASAPEVARIMTACRVHSVAVLGFSRDGHGDPVVWGIVSDLDLLDALRGGERADTTAGDLAHQPVISIRATASVPEVAEAMVVNRTQHLVVIDPDGQTPLGIVSTLDVAGVLAGLPADRPTPALADVVAG